MQTRTQIFKAHNEYSLNAKINSYVQLMSTSRTTWEVRNIVSLDSPDYEYMVLVTFVLCND